MSDSLPIPEGPWSLEPDMFDWTLEGYYLIMRRNPMHSWCGYVGVPEGHPWHSRTRQEDYFDSVSVHGGVTHAGPTDEIRFVPGKPSLWWVGFDCGHYMDVSPAMLAFTAYPDLCGTYRTAEYVRDQCEGLAAQAKEFAGRNRGLLAWGRRLFRTN